MAIPKEGGNPFNIDPKTVRAAPEQSRFGSGFKKPEELKQQPSTPDRTIYERFHGRRRRSGVLGGHNWNLPGSEDRKPTDREQSGEQQPFQPNPAEQQARERLGKPPPQSEKPSEQTIAAEPFQPNPPEQQTPQRRRTHRERARLAQDPELRSFADELWGKVLTKGRLTQVISEALYRYPDLPPDEAVRRDHDDYQGFSFP